MSSQIDAAENDANKYASMVLYYSHNAEKYLKTSDDHKAGEMMWGAMSYALKTAASKRNKQIKSHKELGKFAKELSKHECDIDIWNSYSHASLLHQNFYESNMNTSLVRSTCRSVAQTIGRIMKKMGYRAP